MSHRFTLLVLVLTAAAVILTLADFYPTALGSMLALPLVLFLPGFALTGILFPGDRLGIPERLVLSVGLSVATTALSGLVLAWTPWGVGPVSLWVALFSVTALEIAVGLFYRLWRFDEEVRILPRPGLDTRQRLLVVTAALVTVLAIQVARTPAPQQGLAGYTLLWVQPTSAPDMIHLGVDSEEFETRKYQLEIVFHETSLEGPVVELNPGETWQGVLHIPMDQLAGEPVTVLLYRLDNPEQVYRHVVWWPPTK